MVLVIEIVVGVAVLLGVAFLASRPDIGGLEDDGPDTADIGLPHDRLLRSEDIAALRFRTVGGIRGVRGYRFGDVDEAMAKVEETLRAAEADNSSGRS